MTPEERAASIVKRRVAPHEDHRFEARLHNRLDWQAEIREIAREIREAGEWTPHRSVET
jgi:hypothetical protein